MRCSFYWVIRFCIVQHPCWHRSLSVAKIEWQIDEERIEHMYLYTSLQAGMMSLSTKFQGTLVGTAAFTCRRASILTGSISVYGLSKDTLRECI
jgi:hypothetical protein